MLLVIQANSISNVKNYNLFFMMTSKLNQKIKLFLYSVIAISGIMLLDMYFVSVPTREVVNSPAFYIALSGLVLLPLFSVKGIAFKIASIISGACLYALILWSYQNYFHGAYNLDYSGWYVTSSFLIAGYVFFFAMDLLMTIVGLHKLRAINSAVYSIKLYEIHGSNQTLVEEVEIPLQSDQVAEIAIDGFDRTLYLELDDCWNTIKEKDLKSFQTEKHLYETIVKFGDTQQLKRDFLVIFQKV